MSKDPYARWAKYERVPKKKASSSPAPEVDPYARWTKYERKPAIISQPEPEPESNYIESIAKGLATGVLSWADLPRLPEHITKAILNIFGGINVDAPLRPEHQEILDRYGIEREPQSLLEQLQERLRPTPNTGGERLASTAAEFIGAGSPFGPHALKKAGKWGVAKLTGESAAAGLASGTAQNLGTEQWKADVGAGLLTPLAFRGIGKGVRAGLGLDRVTPETGEAIRSAERLGIDLPASAMIDNKLIRAQENIAKYGLISGEKQRQQKFGNQEKMQAHLEKLLDNTGVPKTKENQHLFNELYADVASKVPENAAIRPTKTTEIAKEIVDELTGRVYPFSGNEKVRKSGQTVLRNLDPYISDAPITEYRSKPSAPIRRLIEAKQDMNQAINWDKEVRGNEYLLHKLRGGVGEDLARYGEQNPEWHKALRETDAKYSGMEKRDELEKMLEATQDSGGEYLASKLSKLTKKSNKKMRRLVKKEDQDLVNDIHNINKQLYKYGKGNTNPSGTAAEHRLLGHVGGLLTAPMTTIGTTVSNELLDAFVQNILKGYVKNRALGKKIYRPNIRRHLPQLLNPEEDGPIN